MKPYNTGTRMAYGQQPSLFDAPARATDPDTSHEAATAKRSEIATARNRMLGEYRRGPYTANEAARLCVLRYGGCHETYRKRKGELQRAGLIRLAGKRICEVTGSVAEAWTA